MSNRRLSVIMKRQRRSLVADNIAAAALAVGVAITIVATFQLLH